MLARQLDAYDVTNVGAAGTFVVREPGGSRSGFPAEPRRKLPFEVDAAFCEGTDLIRLESDHPFRSEPREQSLSLYPIRGRHTVSLTIRRLMEQFQSILNRHRLPTGRQNLSHTHMTFVVGPWASRASRLRALRLVEKSWRPRLAHRCRPTRTWAAPANR